MRIRYRRIWAIVGLGAALAACSSVTAANTAELTTVVARDGVPFVGPVGPAQVIERLARHRVVVLGETHHLREHYEFTTELLRSLHGRGFRQLLVEQPQMADWWIDSYVTGGSLQPGWDPPANWQRKYAALRAYNAGLPPGERIRVRAIDANESYYGGAAGFRSMLGALVGHFSDPGPVAAFLGAAYATAAAQIAAIDVLGAALDSDRAALVASWGTGWYDTVVEMVEVERASVGIRADRADHDERAARTREGVIKQLADARIAGFAHGTVINIGGNHAQKSHLKGTEQEWLGDYLVHRSPATGGSVFVVSFVSARTVLEPGSTGTPVDVLGTSPPDELFRVMAEAWPGKNVFLPLDDPIFSEGRVRVSFEETIYVCPLQVHYDAVLQYGLAHRVPID